MSYLQSSLLPIIKVLETGEILSPTEISLKLGKSKVIIHKYLKELIKQKKIKKIGKGTHVKYKIVEAYKIKYREPGYITNVNIEYKYIDIIDKEFFKFDANGEILKGFQGFKQWCIGRNFDIKSKAEKFYKIYNHIQSIQNECGMLNVTKAFSDNISPNYIDTLFYADQYKWMEFGRGKLAEMTFYAKQGQNIKMIKDSINMIWNKINCMISKTNFDAIVIIPHSIKRINQLLYILKKELYIFNLPFIELEKYFPHNIPIPQKSLKTRKQRIQNAQNTILIKDPSIVKKHKNVLLIDDFVGSGATLNETAKKLKDEGAKKVVGFAFVGNANLTYDVINEV